MGKKHRAIRKSSRSLFRFKHHPFVIPITTFLSLFFVTLVAFISLGGQTVGPSDIRVVNLYQNGEQQTIPTRARTVGDLLKRLDIELHEKDIVEPAVTTEIADDNFSVNLYRARPVLIEDGDNKTVIVSAAPTPEGVAEMAGLSVFPEDKIEKKPAKSVDVEDILKEGVIAERVVIRRATLAHINLYGTPFSVRSHSDTVAELLKEKNIKLNDGDTLSPTPEATLSENTQVFIVSNGKQIAHVEEQTAAPVETVDDYNLTLGTTQIKQAGRPGKKIITYEVKLENGVEASRQAIQEIIVEAPIKKILARGRKAPVVAGNKAEIMTAAGISSNEFYAADYIISHESGWRVNALNPRGCAGLGQACPGSKLAAVCPNWQSDAVCQMRYFTGYARGRYGSWSRAFEVWQLQRWW